MTPQNDEPEKGSLPETERSILSVLLNDSYSIIPVMGVLEDPSDFSRPEYQAVYGAILALTKQSVVPNVYTVADKLGWPIERLQTITAGFNTKLNQEVLYLADIVVREARWRDKQKALAEIQAKAEEGTDDVEAFATWAAGRLMNSGDRRAQRDPGIQAVTDRLDAEVEDRTDGALVGFDAGSDWMNDKTGGICPNHVWVLAAPYKGRKTSLARNLVINACRAGASVNWFALEGDQNSTAAGLIAMLATEKLWTWGMREEMHVSETFIQRGYRSEAQADAIAAAKEELREFNLRIYDGRDRIHTAEHVVHKVKRDQFLYGMNVFVVDYLQLMGDGKLFDRMETSTHAMQTLIQENGLTGILLTQLSESTIWMLDDDDDDEGHYSPGVKGGGDVPAAADFLFVTRYRSQTPDELKVKLKLARHARTGFCNYEIDPSSGRVLRELASDAG